MKLLNKCENALDKISQLLLDYLVDNTYKEQKDDPIQVMRECRLAIFEYYEEKKSFEE